MSVKKCKAALVTQELDGALVSTTPSASIVEDTIDAELPNGALLTEVGLGTWDKWVAEYGRGYHYWIPTGEDNIIQTGDDAWIENNYFSPFRSESGLKAKNQLVTNRTLLYPNSFGNYARWTDTVGGSLYGGIDQHWVTGFDTDGWGNAGAIPVAGQDGIFGEDNCMKVYAGSGTEHRITDSAGSNTEDTYFEGRVYLPSTNTNVNSIRLVRLLTTNLTTFYPTPDTWYDFSFNMGNLTNTSWGIFLCKDGADFQGLNDPNDDLVYFKDLRLRRVNSNGSDIGYLIDHYTGMGWGNVQNWLNGESWSSAVTKLTGTDFGGLNNTLGYTDWFVPNIRLLYDLRTMTASAASMGYPFKGVNNAYSYMSTTTRGSGDDGYHVGMGFRNTISHQIPASNDVYMFCRKHF